MPQGRVASASGVEKAVLDTAFDLRGQRPRLMDVVSDFFEDLISLKQLLAALQLALDIGRILTAAPDAEIGGLLKGRFDDLAAWVKQRIKEGGGA